MIFKDKSLRLIIVTCIMFALLTGIFTSRIEARQKVEEDGLRDNVINFANSNNNSSRALVTIDCNSLEYPALVRKFGVGTQWNNKETKDINYMETANKANASLVVGNIELRPNVSSVKPEEQPKNSTFGPEPLFYKNTNNKIKANLNENMLELRKTSKDNNLLLMMQYAGVPDDGYFKIDPKSQKTATDWAPLPVKSQFDDLANALGDLAGKLYNNDGIATMWSFYQEPEHTLHKALSKDESRAMYFDFYKLASTAVKKANRDLIVTGIQQNASQGRSSGGKIDGAGYKKFADMFLNAERKDGKKYALDYVSINNYQGNNTDEIIKNSRIAYGNDRFNMSPIMFIEYNFRKIDQFPKELGGNMTNDPKLVTTEFMPNLKYLIEQPDLAYSVFARNSNVLRSKPYLYYPVEFYGTMPSLRNYVNISGQEASKLDALASSDNNKVAILVWNKDSNSTTFDLQLNNIHQKLLGNNNQLIIEIRESQTKTSTKKVKITSKDQKITNLTLPKHSFAMIRLENTEVVKQELKQAKYARHNIWVPRLGVNNANAPNGMGFYDTIDNKLIASVKDESGIGLSGVVLKDVPKNKDYKIYADLFARGMPKDNKSSVYGLRVDYLNGDQSMKTVFYRDKRYLGNNPFNNLNGWTASKALKEIPSFLGNGSKVTLNIGEEAPDNWKNVDKGSRRIQISLIIRGVSKKAISEATLYD